MCATNLWAVNAAAFTPGLRRFTTERIGAPVEVSAHRIVSSQVRPSAAVFTITRTSCDCATLVGRGDEPAARDEASAEDWLGWLRDLPDHVPHVSRVAVLRAWSPRRTEVVPVRTRSTTIGELTQDVLRGVGDDTLLAIGYPRTG